VKVRAQALFETLDMPQKPDALRILDERGDEVFVWSPRDMEPETACRHPGILFVGMETNRRTAMANVHYLVVEHEDGWAYKVGDVFSERYTTHDEAREAAERAAAGQMLPGATENIEFQDEAGDWHEEVALGRDRPATDVTG